MFVSTTKKKIKLNERHNSLKSLAKSEQKTNFKKTQFLVFGEILKWGNAMPYNLERVKDVLI